MLEKLDEVKWHELKTSFGQPATDVPYQIRRLLSPSPKERDKAKWMLKGLLCNEYQAGTATLAAVPFLIDLLQSEQTPDKQNILYILADSLQYSEATPEEISRVPFRQLEVQVGQAITKGRDVYIELLEHPDWQVRLASIRLLTHSSFPKEERKRIKTVYKQFETVEQHPKIREFFAKLDQYEYWKLNDDIL